MNTKRKMRAVARRDGMKCSMCGKTDNLTLDHKKPRVFFADSRIENLQILCRACHDEKERKYNIAEMIKIKKDKNHPLKDTLWYAEKLKELDTH